MKAFKMILGIILGVSSIVTLAGISGGDASGAGLSGSLTGFILLFGLAVWLFYSGYKTDSDRNK